jgi:hypothetical protein
VTEPTSQGADEALERIARELHALGAESETARAVKRTVPWLASVLIHLGMFALAVLVAGTVRLYRDREEAPVIVADFDALTYEPVARLNVKQDRVEQLTVQDRVPVDTPEPLLRDEPVHLELEPMQLFSDAASASPPAPFATDAAESTATFVGLTTSNARRIVYVIDASGSLIASLQVVVQELGRSLDALTPRQEFSIIFFQQDRALAVPPGTRLLAATARQKLDALGWIDRNIVPNGNSNPLPALEAALRLKPDVIFLLSDNITGAGQYEVDQRDVLALLDRLNPLDSRTGRRATQINCIQFLDPDPLNTLAAIAREHGGPEGFKFLDRAELGLVRP